MSSYISFVATIECETTRKKLCSTFWLGQANVHPAATENERKWSIVSVMPDSTLVNDLGEISYTNAGDRFLREGKIGLAYFPNRLKIEEK